MLFYRFRSPLGWFLNLLDRPINRFIIDIISQLLFLVLLSVCVAFQIAKDKQIGIQQPYNFEPINWVILVWTVASLVRDVYSMVTMMTRKTVFYDRKRIIWDSIMDILFIVAILSKVYNNFYTLARYNCFDAIPGNT